MNSIASGYRNAAPGATVGASPQSPIVKVVILQRQVNKPMMIAAVVVAVETVGVMVRVGSVSE